MKYFLFYFISILLLFSCNNKKNVMAPAPNKKELMEIDRAFSKMSEEKGMKNAFIEYIDSNGVLLRTDRMPIIGANAIDYLIQLNDTGFALSWEPNDGGIASSGDLGYTYGIYAMRPNGKDTVIYGTYTSIWKKEKNGKWKFILDTGNEGLGNNAADNE